MQKSHYFLHFSQIYLKLKSSDLKIITNRFGIKFCTINFLQILILTKNEFLISFQGMKNFFIRAKAHGLISEENILFAK
jgi:hypothetical protein